MTYSSEVLADSPLFYWELGDTTGTTATDASGNARPGAYNGTYTLNQASLVPTLSDPSVKFTPNAYIQINFATWINVATVTAETWFNATTTGTRVTLMSRDNTSTGRCWNLQLNTANKLEFTFWTSTAGPFVVTGATALTSSTTHYGAATFDGTTAVVYLDGAPDATLTQSGTLKTSTAFGLVTSTQQGGSSWFTGRLDEVAMYGTALSSTRIAAHYTAGTSGGGGSTPRGAFREAPSLRRQAVIRASSY